MEKIKPFFKKYLWLFIIVGAIAAYLAVSWLIGEIGENRFDNKIQKNQNSSREAVREASNHNTAAANASVERLTEDGVRDRAIKPKLETARRNSQNSRARVETARRKYENDKKTNPQTLNSNSAANCRDLASLFPDVRFEDCQ